MAARCTGALLQLQPLALAVARVLTRCLMLCCSFASTCACKKSLHSVRRRANAMKDAKRLLAASCTLYALRQHSTTT